MRKLPAVREITIVALVVVLPGLRAATTKTNCWLFASTGAGMGLGNANVSEFAVISNVKKLESSVKFQNNKISAFSV